MVPADVFFLQLVCSTQSNYIFTIIDVPDPFPDSICRLKPASKALCFMLCKPLPCSVSVKDWESNPFPLSVILSCQLSSMVLLAICIVVGFACLRELVTAS